MKKSIVPLIIITSGMLLLAYVIYKEKEYYKVVDLNVIGEKVIKKERIIKVK